MKNKFYRPENNNLEKFNEIIAAMEKDLNKIINGHIKEDNLICYADDLAAKQKTLDKDKTMGFWGFVEPDEVPADVRVLYFYKPTYLATSILVAIKRIIGKRLQKHDEIIIKGLNACTGRSFEGAGYDDISGLIEAIMIFQKAKVDIFIMEDENFSSRFAKQYKKAIDFIEKSLEGKETTFAWGFDAKDGFEKIIGRHNDCIKEDMIKLFVYGTLLSGNSQNSLLSNDNRCYGEYILEDYALYDLGEYPGIKPKKDAKVKGEVYNISTELLYKIDKYEVEGNLYKRQMVSVHNDLNEWYDVLTYVYLNEVDNNQIILHSNQPWENSNNSKKDYVWYACYGSNLKTSRFMKYINKCNDKTPPSKVKAVMLNHSMYFAKSSKRWGKCGVSFLDVKSKGNSYGKLYKTTRKQLLEIQKQEGNSDCWYGNMVCLGSKERLPIYTLTSKCVHDNKNYPSLEYLNVIYEGIIETHKDVNKEDIYEYLYNSFLRNSDKEVLVYLRSKAHGRSIGEISKDMGVSYKDLVESIKRLKNIKFICQDGRTIAEWYSKEAVYYTQRHIRNYVDRINIS